MGASWLGELGREGGAGYFAASPVLLGSDGSVLADDRCRVDPFCVPDQLHPLLIRPLDLIQFKIGIYSVCFVTVSIALFWIINLHL